MKNYSEFLSDEQYERYTHLLNKFSSNKRMSLEEELELEDLMAIEDQGYQTPEYLAFAAKMDALIAEKVAP